MMMFLPGGLCLCLCLCTISNAPPRDDVFDKERLREISLLASAPGTRVLSPLRSVLLYYSNPSVRPICLYFY
ncbi:hypothetical protein DFS34DRAFT_140043 [Phlyctochytrium arcticum]|nr:hypothetical protein DFS34DRAFT_140043 [Phlyctochytrium arcticum]